MIRKMLFALTLTMAPSLAGGTVAAAQTPTKNDYAEAKNWLCRPGQKDACAVDLTVVAADGNMKREAWKADPKARIDCFYVYPTVSVDPTPNSDMTPNAEEKRIAAAQAARFASQCRVFAPMYRQITLSGLRAGLLQKRTPERTLALDDVLDAWNYYLQHDNNGRGFVLIGHSQGSLLLTGLIAREIEGKPIQARLVSAILLGSNVTVPKGKDMGGTFKSIAICRSASQLGCVIAYASFRSTLPPPDNSLFGRVGAADMMTACTNPAALAGGNAEIHSYLNSTGLPFILPTKPTPWVEGKTVNTPWVSVPGLLTAACVTNEHGSYLEVTVHGSRNDLRATDIAGDVPGEGDQPDPSWGLHLIDVNLTLGNLLDIVRQQARAYAAKARGSD